MDSYLFIVIVFILFIIGGIYLIVLAGDVNKVDNKKVKKK